MEVQYITWLIGFLTGVFFQQAIITYYENSNNHKGYTTLLDIIIKEVKNLSD